MPSQPQQPDVESVNKTAVIFSWEIPQFPNGVILEYEITYYGFKNAEKTVSLFSSIIILLSSNKKLMFNQLGGCQYS